MNLPNTITIARIVLVPVFLVLAYGDSTAAAVGAFVVFLVASLSDSLDGYLARKNETISRMGQFLDPLADKLLVGAALVVLVDTRDFPLWAALLIALREVAVQILRTSIVSGGGNLPASSVAKAKTVLQISMVCWWLLPWAGPNVGHWLYLTAALIVTFWSGFEYFIRAEKDPGEVSA
ncbi:MAG: CDP-diacylglycerol---glycerol-3-phosphate 3-phosphatidyltransferase [Actinomycetota bacterium]|jgi:CDP-diacylglycerol--glycerol-3-phosphate 3-phosphatidyltransferase|nr:CDP-diacylglycerol---glycerol-3-phosphate 3-phosphatidyltransferase [Actinomycetota bacterium]